MIRLTAVLGSLLALLSLSHALAISYTVQVVALSDQDSALKVQRTLLDERFPAYVVRATTAQGDIYRVRVGAFANRAAALLYAETMPVVAGSPPLPALAEGIPSGVMPLEPRVLAELAERRVEVFEWRDGVALRVQPEKDRPATYHVYDSIHQLTFDAWRAQPLEDGVLRLRNLLLWPETWEDDAPELREEYRVARLDGLADRLGVEAEQLESLQLRPAYGAPFVVVLELLPADMNRDGTVLGIAAADGPVSGYGPDVLAFGTAELPALGQPLYRSGVQDTGQDETFAGDAWTVTGSGEFFLLLVNGDNGGRRWKAGVGAPVWSDGRHLLARAADRLYFYDFVPR